jgi:phage shock protein C
MPAAMTTTGARVLRRSREDRFLAGVCGGLGRYRGIDPGWFRIVFLLFGLAAAGVLAYALAWLAIPEERPGDELGPPTPRMALQARRMRVRAERGGYGRRLGRWLRRTARRGG